MKPKTKLIGLFFLVCLGLGIFFGTYTTVSINRNSGVVYHKHKIAGVTVGVEIISNSIVDIIRDNIQINQNTKKNNEYFMYSFNYFLGRRFCYSRFDTSISAEAIQFSVIYNSTTDKKKRKQFFDGFYRIFSTGTSGELAYYNYKLLNTETEQSRIP